MNGRAEITMEEVVFVLLNLVFFSMLFLFVYNLSTGAFVLDKLYAKELALIVNSANPGTQIKLDVSDAYILAEENKIPAESIFNFDDDHVLIKLSDSRVFSYPYFNDISIEKEFVYEGFEDEVNGNDKVFLVLNFGDEE